MSLALESALVAELQTVCPRVYPMVAPLDTPQPYVTWQHVGGPNWRWVENTAPAERAAWVQINVWAATVAAALQVMQQIEEALCTSAVLVCRALAEPIGQHAAEVNHFGFHQDFEVVGAR